MPHMSTNLKKAFASDFDGTLHFARRAPSIDPAAVTAIRQFQDSGGLFGLCTGRPYRALLPLIDGLIHPDFYITSSGACVLDASGATLSERRISFEAAARVFEFGESAGLPHMLHVGGAYYMLASDPKLGIPVSLVRDFSELACLPIHDISFMACDAAEAERITAEINGRFGHGVAAFRNKSAIDVVPAGCSKGVGCGVVRQHFGADTLFGMGDSANDLPLVEAADYSYTFAGAPEALRAAANRIVSTICDALEDATERDA